MWACVFQSPKVNRIYHKLILASIQYTWPEPVVPNFVVISLVTSSWLGIIHANMEALPENIMLQTNSNASSCLKSFSDYRQLLDSWNSWAWSTKPLFTFPSLTLAWPVYLPSLICPCSIMSCLSLAVLNSFWLLNEPCTLIFLSLNMLPLLRMPLSTFLILPAHLSFKIQLRCHFLQEAFPEYPLLG